LARPLGPEDSLTSPFCRIKARVSSRPDSTARYS
jgi:hypothetical protein